MSANGARTSFPQTEKVCSRTTPPWRSGLPPPAPGCAPGLAGSTQKWYSRKGASTFSHPDRGSRHVPHHPERPPVRCGQPPLRDADAFTRYLPDRFKGAIDYVDVHGRTKIVVRGVISNYIPNPTFEVVARPGAQEEYFRVGNPEGKSRREIFGKPMKSIPAFRDPASRLALMDEQGIDRALMFPTLASLIEERMRDTPELTHEVIHSLNQWLYETWSFDYEGRIFATPIITLPIVERAIEELEWVLSGVPGWCSSGPLRRTATAGLARSAKRSSTPSGRRWSTTTCSWPCTPRTAATSATRTTGRAATPRCSPSSPRPSGCSRPGGPSRTPYRR